MKTCKYEGCGREARRGRICAYHLNEYQKKFYAKTVAQGRVSELPCVDCGGVRLSMNTRCGDCYRVYNREKMRLSRERRKKERTCYYCDKPVLVKTNHQYAPTCAEHYAVFLQLPKLIYPLQKCAKEKCREPRHPRRKLCIKHHKHEDAKAHRKLRRKKRLESTIRVCKHEGCENFSMPKRLVCITHYYERQRELIKKKLTRAPRKRAEINNAEKERREAERRREMQLKLIQQRWLAAKRRFNDENFD